MPNFPLLLTSSTLNANSTLMEVVKEVVTVTTCTSNHCPSPSKGTYSIKCICNTLNTGRGKQRKTAVARIIGRGERTGIKGIGSISLGDKRIDQGLETEERRTRREREKDHRHRRLKTRRKSWSKSLSGIGSFMINEINHYSIYSFSIYNLIG